ncbi:MAG: translocation/assembly module TamB domain-containing protein [Dokdonia sp.]
MKEDKVKTTSRIKKIRKIVLRVFLVLLVLFGTLLILFSIPAVQTRAAKYVTDRLNRTYNTDINIDRLGLKWNGDVNLQGVLINDHHQDSLIYAQAIATSVISVNNIISGTMDLGSVDLESPALYIKKYQGETSDNLSIFSKQFSSGKPSTGEVFILSTPNIAINNGRFSYTDENLNTPKVLDYKNLHADIDDFTLEGDVVDAYINDLGFDTLRGYDIETLEGEVHYDPEAIWLHDFTLSTAASVINGNINLDTRNNALSDFNNEVQIDAAFAKASISTSDIKPFYDGLAPDKMLHFKGSLKGTLNDFNVSDLDLEGMNSSKIKGDVTFKNLVDGDDFSIEGDYTLLQSNYFDLKALLPSVLASLPKELIKMGKIRYSGYNKVTSQTLQTKGLLNANQGQADLDLTLEGIQNTDTATYKGHVQLFDFNIGELIDEPKLGKVSLDIDVDGEGLIQEVLDTQLSGTISKISYNGYTYDNINVFGNLKTPVFNGELFVNDEHLNMDLQGLIDVTKAINNYDFTADITYADLNGLGLVKDSIAILKGEVLMDMKGTGISDAFGKIAITDASYSNTTDSYTFKDFTITSSFDDKRVRTIEVNSPDIISGTVTGIYDFDQVVPLFKNAIGSLYTNYQPEVTTEGQYMDFDFTLKNKIVEIFVPEINFEPRTLIRGSVVSNDSEFKLTFKSPRIEAFGNMAQDIEVRVDNKNPLYNTYISADSINAGFYAVSEFNLINVTLKDTLFMRSEFKGGKRNDDQFNLSLYHTINQEGNSVLGFKRSEIEFKDNLWFINEANNAKNSVVFDNNFKDIDIRTLVLSHKDERIDLSGKIKDSTYKDIKANFTNVDLSKITPEIENIDLAGRVNGGLDLLQKDGAYYPNSSIIIDSLGINDSYLGVLDLEIEGNSSLSRYQVKSTLKNQTLKSLAATGVIDVGGTASSIDLDVVLQDFDLKPFDPLGEDVISNIRGLVSGNAKVSGSYKNPDIDGRLRLKDAGLKIPYLNVDYDFKGISQVDLNKQQFIFKSVALEDVKEKTRGTLNGSISHQAFSDWELDLAINTNRLLVLNTKEEIESLYYGTAFISGEASLKGPTDNLVIDVLASTEEGTVFYVPIDDTEAIGDNSYIHFLSPEEKAARINGEFVNTQVNSGLSLNFDLDVDTDALIEIVVDKRNGTKLRGRGAGNLLIEVNTNGKFNMWGDFIVYDGKFDFRYGVAKQFDVVPLGNIRWEGSPERALLDLSATYRTQANPSILLENPSVNRKIPVEVVINLNGELLQPDIEFEINFPNAGSTVTSELDFRLSDRNTRELNAISLVSQNTFLSATTVSTAGVVNNAFETGSSILSGLLFNNDDGVFDVSLDLVSADRNPEYQSAGRVGITLATQITDRVLINGKVGVPTGGVSESVIVGDVEVDFLLNEDGTLRAKVFNRQSDIQFIGETEGYTQGAGLSYAVDFNSFKGLLRKIFNGKTKEVVQELQEAPPEQEKIGPDGVTFKNK